MPTFPPDDDFVNDAFPNERPRTALRRVLTLLDLLSGYRYGLPLDEAWERVCEITGVNCCRRTVERDLSLIESLNLVERTQAGWRLSPRANNISRVAGSLSHD